MNDGNGRDMNDLEPPGDELERRLERYSRVRLEPSHSAMRRVRGAVMASAWRSHLAGESAAGVATRRLPFTRWSVRRLGASLAAAVLAGLLLGTTAFAGSRAGGPLYDVRLAFEEATLPADPDARLEAELALAQTRLAEAAEAAARGDDGAMAAALGAYGSAIGDLESVEGGPAGRALEAVESHRTVLLGLSERLPEAASDGIARALDRSSQVIERLQAAGTPGGGNGAGTQKSPRPDRSQPGEPIRTPNPPGRETPGTP